MIFNNDSSNTLSYHCPYCNHDATLLEETNFANRNLYYGMNSDIGEYFGLRVKIFVCPNPKCKRFSAESYFFKLEANEEDGYSGATLCKNRGNFGSELTFLSVNKREDKKSCISLMSIPQSHAKILPNYIPKPLIDDYNEACAILLLSPKASATLARRCLQGMIRDFWNIKEEGTLAAEIKAIKEKVDPIVWRAIDVVRGMGNIGAHMEKDINKIIEIDDGEAEKLINLLEMLFSEWYINRYNRKEQLQQISKIVKK